MAASRGWVPVASGWGVGLEVEVVRGLLQSAGIPAELTYRPFAEMMGWPMGSLTPVSVIVPASLAEEATAVLAARPEAPWTEAAERELAGFPSFPRGLPRVATPYLFAFSPPFSWPFGLVAIVRWLRARREVRDAAA